MSILLLGGCKHADAVLTWLYRRSEDKACTSVQCYWKTPRLGKAGQQPRQVDQLKANAKKRKVNVTCENTESVFNDF
jgi:hypothetical protein